MSREQTAVILLNYLSWQETLEEAKQVKALFDLKPEQIILVDNASPNGSARLLREHAPEPYVLLTSPENRGYAAGNNLGLRCARDRGFRYAWILNNDIRIEDPALLDGMLRILKENPAVAVVSPDILSPDGHLYNRDAKRPTLRDFTLGLKAWQRIGREVKDLGGYGYVYRPQGCCMLLDLEKTAAVGDLDEATFLYCEEMILAERLLKKDMRCACFLSGKVVHDHSRTVKSALGKWKQLKTQNRSFRYYLKAYRGFGPLSRAVCLAFYTLKNMLTN